MYIVFAFRVLHISVSGGRCVYNIKSGDATYKLVLLYDGGILIDGQFPQSVIYKQGASFFWRS